MEPSGNISEAVLISGIINDDDAMGSAIVAGSNSAKSFLTSSVPLEKPKEYV